MLLSACGNGGGKTGFNVTPPDSNSPESVSYTHLPQKPRDGRVEFEDVSFTYNGAETPALSHVSFTVEPGRTVALVGPSGGGKTTAASLIPRFWDVTSGMVKVGGCLLYTS